MQLVQKDNISSIQKALSLGQIVALPTDTVFGLAAALNSATALEKLIYLKRRDLKSGKIFALVPESKTDIEKYAILSSAAKKYIQAYFPGELTLILPKNPSFSHPYFDHFSTIGIRLPATSLFTQLLPLSGPLFLTSANPRGDTPAISSTQVQETLPKVDLVVEGKTNPQTPPTTILDLTGPAPLILRQGRLEPKIWYNKPHESLQSARNRSKVAKNLGSRKRLPRE